jgi:hypothetical protein
MRSLAATRVLAFALVLTVPLALRPLGAQGGGPAGRAVRVDGFNVSYTPPAGWNVQYEQHRVKAFSDPAKAAFLFVFGGSYTSDEAAFADAQSIFSGTNLSDEQEVEPRSQRRVNGRNAISYASTVAKADGERLALRVLVVMTEHGTALGAVTLAPVPRAGEMRQVIEGVAGSLDAQTPVENRQLAARVTGTWTRQQGYNSNTGGGGGFINEEAYAFDASGTYRHRSTSVISIPGAAVEPKVEQSAGTWRAYGSSLVLENEDGRMTVDVQWEGNVAIVNGTRFIRR